MLPSKVNRSWSAVRRTPSETRWESVTLTTNRWTRKVTARTNVVVELGAGLNVVNGSGSFVSADPSFEITAAGAESRNAAHRLEVPADIGSGEGVAITHQGQQLVFQPIALSYFDPTDDRSVLLDSVTNAIGWLTASNIVVYSNCFPQLRASIRIKNTRFGTESDVVFTERPPDPKSVGLSRYARIECVTEQLSGANPAVGERIMRSLEPGFLEPAMKDSTLSFNGMKMITGRAFMLGTNGNPAIAEAIPATVGKTYYTNAGRRFIIEGVEHERVAPALLKLPTQERTMTNAALDKTVPFRSASFTRDLPEKRVASIGSPKIQDSRRLFAAATPSAPAFLLDWTLVNESGITNYTFLRNVTYLINGYTPAVGVTRFQSAILKYAEEATLSFGTNDTAVFETEDFALLTCTSIDNDAVGEVVTGSSGTPYQLSSTWAFEFATGNRELHDIRMSHLNIGVWSHGGTITARNVQAVNLSKVFQVDSTSTLNVYNCLSVGSGWLYVGDAIQFNGQHITAHAGTVLGFAWQTNSSTAVVKNSLLIQQTYPPYYAGAYTGIETVQSSSSGIFQSGLCGNYYLNGSTYRDIGTTNIDATLLQNIRRRTTYPPQMLTTPMPRAWRDTNAIDLGFHYSPVDVIASNVVGSATFGPDTVIALNNSYYSTFDLAYGHSLNSQGTPDLPNRFLYASAVQESPDSAIDPGPLQQHLARVEDSSPQSSLNFYSTYFLMGGDLLEQAGGSPSLTFQNCRLYDCSLSVGGNTVDSSSFNFINTLFDHSSLYISANSYWCSVCIWDDMLNDWVDGYMIASVGVTARNNLFFHSAVTLNTDVVSTLTDNLFDGTAPSVDLAYMTASHNGFTTGTDNSLDGANDVEGIVPDNLSGPLGRFYYPTNGTNLARLINAGSQTATAAGLYHFTTTTNLMETNSTVDIGWHFPATGADGQPLDTDGDGIANVREDLNGNGSLDAGETPWLLGIIAHPQSRSVNAGSNVVFSVTAVGTSPIYYQWRFNGVAIAGANSSSFTVWNAYPSVAGSYSVLVTNIGGSLTSQVASLTVNMAPWIISHPTNRVVALGNSATFSVVAGGTASLGYQWRFNGTNLTGATNSSVTVTAHATNLGAYSVLVSNMAGSVTSSEATLSVVLVNRVVVNGSNPEIAHSQTICSGESISLRAMPDPWDATFPTTPSPLIWTLLSQPSGSALTNTNSTQLIYTFTPIVSGTYVIRAKVNNSSNNFTLTCINPNDIDYNGLGGCQELANGSNFLRMRLGQWPFDSNSFVGLQGQLPLSVSNVSLVNGWSVLAAGVSPSNGPAQLLYRETESGSAIANINCREGSLRFWFRPDWNSTGTNSGSGPGGESRLIELGSKGTTNGWWGLVLNAAGTNLNFGTQTNDTSTLRTNVFATVRWRSNDWQHIALTYASTGTVVYLNGQAVAFGIGVSNWPGSTVRAQGFRVGTDPGGTNWAKGDFDNLETFNYPLSASEIANHYAYHPRPTPTNACLLAPIALYYAIGTALTNGEVAYSTNGAGSGNFGWLSWSGDGTPNTLAIALTNFWMSTNFVNSRNSADRTLSVEDWIYGNSGLSPNNAVTDSLLWLTNQGIQFGIVLWNNASGTGGNTEYQAAGYAKIKLLEYNFNGGNKWLKYQYLGPTDCDSISNRPPTISLLSPTSNQVFNLPANVRMTALAWDPEDMISSVQYFSGTNLLGTTIYSLGMTNMSNSLFSFSWSGMTNGDYSLKAVVTDQLGLRSTSQVVSVMVNQAPLVNAGATQSMVWPNNPVTLAGTITDDGRPNGTITSLWTRVSGPGPVVFSNASATNSTVTLSTNGLFKLRLTGGDGGATASSNVTITVFRPPLITIVNPVNGAGFESGFNVGIDALASDFDGTVTQVCFYRGTNLLHALTNAPYSCTLTNPALTNHTLTAVAKDNHGLSTTSAPVVITITEVNFPPAVSAGGNQTILCPENQATLHGVVTDDGRPSGASVSWFWSKVSGPGTVTFNDSNSLAATATFSTNGIYVLRLSATDTAATTTNDTVVSFLCPPSVSITNPSNGTFSNAPLDLRIDATATDGDGTVTQVMFYAGEFVVGFSTNTPFSITWTNPSPGDYLLTAVATDNSGLTNASLPVSLTINQVPEVYASVVEPMIVWPVNQVTLTGLVMDDGRPTNGTLTTAWTFVSGPGSVTFGNSNALTTRATFSTNGIYLLRLSANDGAATNHADVTITIQCRPFISITNPPSGAVLNAPVNVSVAASASDLDGSVTQIQFFAGPILVGTAVAPAYSIIWTNPTAGTYSLTAVATDDSGLTSISAPVVVVVNQAPLVSAGTNQLIHWPANQVTLYGTASDDGLPNGILTTSWSLVSGSDSVTFGNSNTLSTTATFSTNGVYTLRLTASDGSALGTSDVVITVNLSPTVSITAPTNSQVFVLSPTNMTLTASASDSDGSITLLQIYQGTNLLGQGASNSLNLGFSNVAAGTYTLFARAVDNRGGSLDSLPVTVFVARPFSYTYTLDVDFDSGTLVNLNHLSPTNDQLQLNQRITPFPFVNVACAVRGTMVRIDVNTGEIIGEYHTAPQNMGKSPSRTTVDRFGNVWVANRGEYGESGGEAKGSAVRIGVVIGGTRGSKNPDGSFTPNPTGDYLQPPFYYNTCQDRDGDGLIKTSRGRGHILPWSNSNLVSNFVDSDGDRTNASGAIINGVSTAEDEAIINYIRVPGTGTRTLALDANSDLWVGSYDNGWHEKYSGLTGLAVPGTKFRFPLTTNWYAGGYGGLVDGNGVLWSARGKGSFDTYTQNHLLRYDPATQQATDLGHYNGTYGLAVDPVSGHIWMTGGGSSLVWELLPDGTTVTNHYLGGTKKGIVVDEIGNVWTANEDLAKVEHRRTSDGALIGNVDLRCGSAATGVAVDSNGKIWVTLRGSDQVMRIDPLKGPRMLNDLTNAAGLPLGEVDMVVNVGTGADPYNYSDMTGFVSLGTTARSGTWTVVQDSQNTATRWNEISWNASLPTNTSLRVEVRGADSYAALPAKAFIAVSNGYSFYASNVVGRYVEVRTTLGSSFGNTNSPVLYDLTITSSNMVSISTNELLLSVSNHNPVVHLDEITVRRNSITNILDVLANDTDEDGDELYITGTSPVQHGSLSLSTDATRLIYTPDPLFFGADQFTYTAVDGHGGFARGAVRVQVSRIAASGVTTASNDVFVVQEGNSSVLLNVLDNDFTAYEAPLLIATATPPLHGTLWTNNCGTRLLYSPSNNFAGVDFFTYTIRDTNGGTSTATGTVYVVNIDNDAAVPNHDYYTNAVNSTNVLQVLLNDYDYDGDPLSIAQVYPKGAGTISISTDRQSVIYVPALGWEGIDNLGYYVVDEHGAGSWGEIFVTVTNGTNDPPWTTPDFYAINQDASTQTLYVRNNDGDGDSASFIVSAVTQPGNGTAGISGDTLAVTYVPNVGFFGTNTFTYTVQDPQGATATETVTILVKKSGNSLPSVNGDYTNVLVNSSNNALNPLVNDSDPNGDTLSLFSLATPNHGSVSRSGNVIYYTPSSNYLGTDTFAYTVTDGLGGLSQSTITFYVITNRAPLAYDDSIIVTQNNLDVLGNDSDPDGDSFSVVATTQGTNGATIAVCSGGTCVSYQPATGFLGQDNFKYTIRDALGAEATANVTVFVKHATNNLPTGVGDSITVGRNSVDNLIAVLANDYDVNGDTLQIVRVNPPSASAGTVWATPTNIFFTPAPGVASGTYFTYEITDGRGGWANSIGVSVTVANDMSQPPVAILASLSNQVSYVAGVMGSPYPVIRDGLVSVTGTATDPDISDAVSYHLIVLTSDGVEVKRTIAQGRVNNALLGTLDFTGVQNGVYDVRLQVYGGAVGMASTEIRVILESNAKIGQFSFSEQDATLPAGGLPLSVMRTYNSLNSKEGDFGFSWTYSLVDLQIEFDEDRIDVQDFITDDVFNLRIGGGRSVTMTLPDGRRTTFAFSLEPGASEDGVPCFCYEARWTPPPNVIATLTPTVSERLIVMPGLWPYWEAAGMSTPLDYFDFKGFTLGLQDGTQFDIVREDLDEHDLGSEEGEYAFVHSYGKASVKTIRSRSGDRMEITAQGFDHYNPLNELTRSLRFQRDSKHRITAIFDPMGLVGGVTSGPPALKYEYDSVGNLSKVLRLVDRAASRYLTNTYLYENASFPHYITTIKDARGYSVARNLYDDQGRLIGIMDANGRTNRMEHDITGRREILYDKKGIATVHLYDSRGNVTNSVDALGHTNSFLYDTNGYMLAQTDPLGNVTTYSNDANGNVLSVTLPYPAGADPTEYTTRFTYDAFGQQLTVALPSGAVQTNKYDAAGNLIGTTDENGVSLFSAAYANGLQVAEGDKFGTNFFAYDSMGNVRFLTNSLGKVTTSDYDANGNLTNLVDGINVSAVQYDALGREALANYGNGITLSNHYNSQLDWNNVSGPTIGSMERRFDEQGRLAGWTTANGATPGFAYDENGRLLYETNSIGQVTQTTYDAAGRAVAVTNLTTGAGAASFYDAAGRRIYQEDALGHGTWLGFNPDGSLAATTNALGYFWQFSYDVGGVCCGGGGASSTTTDPFGRQVTEQRSPQGLLQQRTRRSGTNVLSLSMTYLDGMVSPDQEAEEYPTTVIDEGGRLRQFGYTALGQLERATDLGGNWFTNQYDADSGALTNVLGPTGERLAYVYDDLDNVKAIGFGDGNWLTNFYSTGTNRLMGVRFPSGATNALAYDSAGRLMSKVSSIGEMASFQYNWNDAVTVMSDNTGSTTNLYDAAGRLHGINYPWGATVRYGFDLLGRVTSLTNTANAAGSNWVVRYSYDALGNITNVNALGQDTRYEYDGVGRRTKRALPNGVITDWQYDWRDYVTNVIHKRFSDGQTLMSFGYVRANGGEPTRIIREDGSYVNLNYDAALRLTNEVYRTAGGSLVEEIAYGYDAAGNRTRFLKAGTTLTNAVSGGYRITQLKNASNGSVMETNGYDSGGRVTAIYRDSMLRNLGYNTADQLTAVTNGAAWVSYAHDAAGRRTVATNYNGTATVRRFVMAGTPETDLESPLLITDTNGAVQQGFVYLGRNPLLRFDANGTPVYYLEDAMGSIAGLADNTATKTASFNYDGFGNLRTHGGSTNTPTGTEGDFRFHGAWWEKGTDLYHVRAREYDQQTGRFISRDPDGGGTETPESLHPFAFADSNPYVFSDPSGEFSVIEVNLAGALQFAMQSLRSAAVNEAKHYAYQKIIDSFARHLIGQMHFFIPGFDFSKFEQFLSVNPLGTGSAFDRSVRAALCLSLGTRDGIGDRIHHNVRVVNSGLRLGEPISAGRNCNGANPRVTGQRRGANYSVPDFIFGPPPLTSLGVGRAKIQQTAFIAEVKSQASTMYSEYILPGRKTKQFDAIIGYARDNTETHVAMFIVAKNDLKSGPKEKAQFYILKRVIGAKSLSRGVIPVMVNIF
jgi:RHS repeat-associated protein